MKQITFIIILIISFACTKGNKNELCLEVLNESEANWLINTDSITSIEELIESKFVFRKKIGYEKKLIPKLKISGDKTLNLAPIRQPSLGNVRRYDYRSVMRIFVFQDHIETLWCQDTLFNNDNPSAYCEGNVSSISNDSIYKITSIIKKFYESNQGMNLLPEKYYNDFQYYIKKLEVHIIFYTKSIEVFPSLAEEISKGYLSFLDGKSKHSFKKGFCNLDESKQIIITDKLPLLIHFYAKPDSYIKGR